MYNITLGTILWQDLSFAGAQSSVSSAPVYATPSGLGKAFLIVETTRAGSTYDISHIPIKIRHR